MGDSLRQAVVDYTNPKNLTPKGRTLQLHTCFMGTFFSRTLRLCGVFAFTYSCLAWKVECKAERNQEWSGRCRTESVWRGDWRLELTAAWSVGTASGRVECEEWSVESGEESGVESG